MPTLNLTAGELATLTRILELAVEAMTTTARLGMLATDEGRMASAARRKDALGVLKKVRRFSSSSGRVVPIGKQEDRTMRTDLQRLSDWEAEDSTRLVSELESCAITVEWDDDGLPSVRQKRGVEAGLMTHGNASLSPTIQMRLMLAAMVAILRVEFPDSPALREGE